jgi:hypothetical protein
MRNTLLVRKFILKTFAKSSLVQVSLSKECSFLSPPIKPQADRTLFNKTVPNIENLPFFPPWLALQNSTKSTLPIF